MPNRFLKNGQGLLFQEQKTILSAAAVIGFLSLISALLGLVKVRLYAGVVGVGTDFDTFVAAFKLPDFIYSLVVLGSLNAAFIPIFSEFIARNEKSLAWKFVSNILNLALIFFALSSFLIFLLAEPLSTLVAAGFPPSQTQILINLMRIMLLSPILLGVSSFVSGSIQSFKRFWVPFLAPVAYNLGGILGVVFLYQPLGVYGLAWGVVLGSFLHLLIQLPLLKHLGFSYTPLVNLHDQLLRKTLALSFPRVLALASDQIKALLVINLASLLQSGSISILRFAESIFTVPLTIIGVSLAQAALPTLSQEEAKGDLTNFKKILTSSLTQILFLIAPISVVLIFLKIPVVRLVLGVGIFDWTATTSVAWVLALLAISLPASAVSHFLIRAFYALKDTKTPVVASVLSVIVSLLTGVALLPFFQLRGLAFGLSLGAILESLLLGFALKNALAWDLKTILSPLLKILISAAAMAACVYLPYKILDQEFLNTSRVVNLLILVWLVLSFGGSIYLILAWILGLDEIKIFIKFLWRLRNLKEELTTLAKFPTPETPILTEETI